LTIGATAIGLVQNAFVLAAVAVQDWATRPITLVLPFAAGVLNDYLLAQDFQ
jgi:tripartite-type tricarboxylate transporter receptor subunit TctC